MHIPLSDYDLVLFDVQTKNLAAAAERTKRMQFVTGVTAPIHRYHPAIIAQAFASLDILYPGRIGLGLGTGESMNETPLGFDWPRPKARLKRVIEAAQIISKLWYTTTNNDNNGNDIKKHQIMLMKKKKKMMMALCILMVSIF
ncbi:MAG: LLM class flavin-dependent oxidoreductase [Nitrososphaeraceae archaeon]